MWNVIDNVSIVIVSSDKTFYSWNNARTRRRRGTLNVKFVAVVYLIIRENSFVMLHGWLDSCFFGGRVQTFFLAGREYKLISALFS